MTSPEDFKIEYALRFNFPISNNEAEYEALLAGVGLAKAILASKLAIYSNSQLVVKLVIGEYEAKEARMAKYLQKVRGAIIQFEKFHIQQVPWAENARADALSKLASSDFAELGHTVYIEVLPQRSIDETKVMQINNEPSWMDPIIHYLKDGSSTRAKV